MRRSAMIVAIAALLATPAAASASSGMITYTGRTSSGHHVTFQVAHNRMYNLRAGVRVSCVPIQGPDRTPVGGTDFFGYKGYVPIQPHVRFKFLDKTALYWNPVTKTHDMWIKRSGNAIKARLRVQFSFLMPRLDPGVFTIYSCLGGSTFTAWPQR